MLTREELQVVYEQGPEATWAVVEQLSRSLQEQQAQLLELRARVKELEAQVALNSRNSSKPPSSDSVTRPPRSLRQRSGRKSGGQPGHPGKTLSLVAEPDHTAVHDPTHCAACGTGLTEVAGELDPERRSHLVRRIAGLPQAFVTTTTLDDLDPALVHAAATWEVVPGASGATLVGPSVAQAGARSRR